MTTPELTEAEKAAGFARFKAWLDEHVSGFKRGFITDEYIHAGVNEIVSAVDEVRDSQPEST